jgi:hypothetical protein
MTRIFSILAAALCLVGCSDSSSSDSLNEIAQGVLDTQIHTQSQGKIHLTSFKKTNGQDMEAMGVKMREIQFEATIEFAASGNWQTGGGGFSSCLSYGFVPGTKPLMFPYSREAILVSAGSHMTIHGTMQGHKTDNGWEFEVASSGIDPGQVRQSSQ